MQADGMKQSPRMVITPRQAKDNSEEIDTLKAEVAALKDEVATLLTASFPINTLSLSITCSLLTLSL